jgi:hypothetical protein
MDYSSGIECRQALLAKIVRPFIFAITAMLLVPVLPGRGTTLDPSFVIYAFLT